MGGNTESKPGQENKEQEPRVNHPRFQNIKFTRNKEDEDRIQVKLPVASIKEYNQWVQALKDAPVQSQNFLLPQSYDFQKEGFCGSAGFVNVLFENFPYVLSDEIGNRASLKQKYFDQPELWYLIYTLLSAAHEFHKNGKKVGDVRPQNVFINQDGQVKVATKLTWPGEYQNYHKTFYEKQPTYLAPEQLKDIQFAKMQPSCDPKLAESFSVGLTCLDAGTLSSSASLYNKNNKFDYNGLSEKLLELQNAGYSQILCLIVSNLCQPDSQRRSTCSELQKWLQPHQQNIINLQRFEVTSLPEKVALYGLGQQNQEIQRTSQNIGQLSPQQAPYPRQIVEPSSISGQKVRIQQQHFAYPPQPFVQGSQTVTYYHPQPFQTQNPVQPPIRQYQPQQIIQQQIPILQQPVPQQKIQNLPLQEVQNRTTINTTSTYTYTGVPPSQYVGNIAGGNTQYSAQTVTYSRQVPESGDRQKSNMQLTLQKIDQQLQMSRKMFPS